MRTLPVLLFAVLQLIMHQRAEQLEQNVIAEREMLEKDNARQDTCLGNILRNKPVENEKLFKKFIGSFKDFLSQLEDKVFNKKEIVDIDEFKHLIQSSAVEFYNKAILNSLKIIKIGNDYFTETMEHLKNGSQTLGFFALKATSETTHIQDPLEAREFIKKQIAVSESMADDIYNRITQSASTASTKIERYSAFSQYDCLQSRKTSLRNITQIANEVRELKPLVYDISGKHHRFTRFACNSVESLAIHFVDQISEIEKNSTKKIEELVTLGFSALESLGDTWEYVVAFPARSRIVVEEVRQLVPRKLVYILEFICAVSESSNTFNHSVHDLKKNLDKRFDCIVSNCV